MDARIYRTRSVKNFELCCRLLSLSKGSAMLPKKEFAQLIISVMFLFVGISTATANISEENFLRAICKGDIDAAKFLVDSNIVDPKNLSENIDISAHLAVCYTAPIKTASWAMKFSKNINSKSIDWRVSGNKYNRTKLSPIEYVVQWGKGRASVRMISILLNHGADVNSVSSTGIPLLVSALDRRDGNSDFEILKMLIQEHKAGFDYCVSSIDSYGSPRGPFHMKTDSGKCNVYLLEAALIRFMRGDSGTTESRKNIIIFLVSAGISIPRSILFYFNDEKGRFRISTQHLSFKAFRI